jgi:hypothetical protein
VRFHLVLLLAPVLTATALAAQAPVDSALDTYIALIRAIDSHAHPLRTVAAGAPADSESDALPLDGIPPFAFQHRLSTGDPVWRRAQEALYPLPLGTGDAMRDGARTAALVASVTHAMADRGACFPEWALVQAGIDVMLANRVAMGPGLASPRLRWVSFVDALMLQLDTRGEAAATPDTRSLYPCEAHSAQTLSRRPAPSTPAHHARLLRA